MTKQMFLNPFKIRFRQIKVKGTQISTNQYRTKKASVQGWIYHQGKDNAIDYDLEKLKKITTSEKKNSLKKDQSKELAKKGMNMRRTLFTDSSSESDLDDARISSIRSDHNMVIRRSKTIKTVIKWDITFFGEDTADP